MDIQKKNKKTSEHDKEMPQSHITTMRLRQQHADNHAPVLE